MSRENPKATETAPLDRSEESASYEQIQKRLRDDAEIYRQIARFRGVPDTPLGRALLQAASKYDEAADAIQELLGICVGLQDAIAGRVTPIENVRRELRGESAKALQDDPVER